MILFKEKEFGSEKSILMFPDNYVAMPQFFAKNSALATDVDGRKIIKAGTIYPSNDANAVGVVFSDLDVTDGDVNGAVIIFGFIATDKLPVAPTKQAMDAMKMIAFLPIRKTVVSSDINEINAANYDISKATVRIFGTSFLEGASTVNNWTLADTDSTNVEISEIEKIDNRTVVITFKTKAESTAKAGKFTITAGAGAVANGVGSNAITLEVLV